MPPTSTNRIKSSSVQPSLFSQLQVTPWGQSLLRLLIRTTTTSSVAVVRRAAFLPHAYQKIRNGLYYCWRPAVNNDGDPRTQIPALSKPKRARQSHSFFNILYHVRNPPTACSPTYSSASTSVSRYVCLLHKASLVDSLAFTGLPPVRPSILAPNRGLALFCFQPGPTGPPTSNNPSRQTSLQSSPARRSVRPCMHAAKQLTLRCGLDTALPFVRVGHIGPNVRCDAIDRCDRCRGMIFKT